MMDTCFGSGKTGFVQALEASAGGRMLTVWVTSHDGSPWQNASLVRSGTHCFQDQVLALARGVEVKRVAARPPAPEPVGGAWQLGRAGFWLRYVDNAARVQIPHWELGKIQRPVVEAYLLPYLNGVLAPGPDGSLGHYAALAASGLLGFALARRLTARARKLHLRT